MKHSKGLSQGQLKSPNQILGTEQWDATNLWSFSTSTEKEGAEIDTEKKKEFVE